MKKTTYEGLRIGDTISLNKSLLSEGRRLEAGTNFKIISFPAKVRKIDPQDLNPKGYQRSFFVYGRTTDNWPVHALLCEIAR